MLPEPLHPAVVHFPLVLAVLLPAAAIIAAAYGWKHASPRHLWIPTVVLALLLTGSSWAALETGEAEEDRVESVVPGSAIHEHEERAELFLTLGAVALTLVLAGLLPGHAGKWARAGAALVAIGVAGAALRVGHSGGELVYTHGAASAYVSDRAATREAPGLRTDQAQEHEAESHEN